MTRRKLLIATTNQGKFGEMSQILETLPFDIISLKNLQPITPPDETGTTLEENAMVKAKYYGEKTGLLTVADDTGLFVDALDGWPGIHAALVASDDLEKRNVLLEKLSGVPVEKRVAKFRSVLCLFEPEGNTLFLSQGELLGKITENEVIETAVEGFGYSPIFFVGQCHKMYSDLSRAEKNAVSHRSKATTRMKYHLQNTYCGKHIVVPFGLIIKDGKVFMQLRNDPHRPEYHKKWEFPGGGMEMGETLVGNVVRELKEEAGYDVEIVKQLNYVGVETHIAPTFQYQIYLIPFVCKIVGGDGMHRDEEVLETGWFSAEEVFEHDLLGTNVKIYRDILPELKSVIAEFSL